MAVPPTLIMSRIFLFLFMVCVHRFTFVLSVDTGCNSTFSFSHDVVVTETASPEDPVVIGEGDGTFVALLFDPNECELSNGTVLYIEDNQTETLLATFENFELENLTSFVLWSFTHQIKLYLNGTNATGIVVLSYDVLHENSLLVDFRKSVDHNIWINSSGSDDCTIVNFRRTWLVSSGEDNVVHYSLVNQTLNDQLGDYLAIGAGNRVFSAYRSLMISGSRSNYPVIDVYGNISYVYLFAKLFTSDIGFSLYYNTTLYIPPTEEPPTTIGPPATLNATVEFDPESDDSGNFLNDFTTTIAYYATKTCQQKKDNVESNVTLSVEIMKIVDVDPCVVIVYYIDIINGSCQGNKSFSVDSYNLMMTNYSKNITNDFRSIGPDCPGSNIAWIISVIVVLVIALVVAIIACCNRKNALYKRLRSNEEPVSVETVKQNSELDEPINKQEIKINPRLIRIHSVSRVNIGYVPDSISSDTTSNNEMTEPRPSTTSDDIRNRNGSNDLIGPIYEELPHCHEE
ncbi:hypothetical protein CHUAL_009692 [Chamberlinius hualienensis]